MGTHLVSKAGAVLPTDIPFVHPGVHVLPTHAFKHVQLQTVLVPPDPRAVRVTHLGQEEWAAVEGGPGPAVGTQCEDRELLRAGSERGGSITQSERSGVYKDTHSEVREVGMQLREKNL